jgi:hypothetical protein
MGKFAMNFKKVTKRIFIVSSLIVTLLFVGCATTSNIQNAKSPISREGEIEFARGALSNMDGWLIMLLSSKIPCFLANKIPYFFSSIFKDLFSVCQPITVICEA